MTPNLKTLMANMSTLSHVSCYIKGDLKAFYTLELPQEAEKMLLFYVEHPDWHLYTEVKLSGLASGTWKREN